MRTAIRVGMAFLAAPLLMMATNPAGGQVPGLPPTPPAPPKPPMVGVADVTFKAAAGTLEEMLAEALKNNPDVRVAESKLREAEAQLNRARMQVMQKAVALRGALDAQKGAVKEAELLLKAAENRAKGTSQLHKNNVVGQATVEEALAAVEGARQKLLAAKTRGAELEGEVNFLLGKHHMRFVISFTDAKGGLPNLKEATLYQRVLQDQATATLRIAEWQLKTVPGSMADRIRKALDKPVRVDAKDKPLADVLKEFQTAHGVNFVIASKKLNETNVTVHSEELPLGAVLEMIEDQTGVRFAVRDYGVLATSAEPLPTGAVPLYTFWKAAKPPAGAGRAKDKEGHFELEIKP